MNLSKTAELFCQRLAAAASLEELKPEFSEETALEQAKVLHATHLARLQIGGYTYAPETNHDPKKGVLTSPYALPFDAFNYETQAEFMAQTAIARTTYTALHPTTFNSIRTLIYEIAEDIHNHCCKVLIDEGFVYGTENDKANLICNSLLPFGVLFNNPKLKHLCDYAFHLARILVHEMIDYAEPAHKTNIVAK